VDTAPLQPLVRSLTNAESDVMTISPPRSQIAMLGNGILYVMVLIGLTSQRTPD
jgi:hypothetical protein